MPVKYLEFTNKNQIMVPPAYSVFNIPVRALGLAKIIIVNKRKKGWD